ERKTRGEANHVYLIQGSGVCSDHILNGQVVRLCDKFNIRAEIATVGNRYLDSPWRRNYQLVQPTFHGLQKVFQTLEINCQGIVDYQERPIGRDDLHDADRLLFSYGYG